MAIERLSLHSFSTKTRPGLFRKWKDLLNVRDNFGGQKTASRTETHVSPSEKRKKLQTAFQIWQILFFISLMVIWREFIP